MAKKVKDYYDVPYLEELAGKIMAVTNNFNKEIFLKETKDKIENLEFNQRQELIAKALYKAFDLEYDEVLNIFSKILGFGRSEDMLRFMAMSILMRALISVKSLPKDLLQNTV